jgi:uncharacterized protein DUF5946
MQTCPGCGLALPDVDGPTDPYAGASPACWAMFSEVCARDYGEYRYPDVHRLIVDAYMAQHPGYATPAGRRSVAVHLVALCCTFEEGMANKDVLRVLSAGVFPDKRDTPALEPVPPPGPITIAHVHAATSLEEHVARARGFARAVWEAWTPHHPRIRALRPAARR